MQVSIQHASRENFRKFGELVELEPRSEATVAVETVDFWQQQAVYHIKGETEVGVLHVRNMPMVFDELENHFHTPTGLVCLDGDCVIALATPGDEVPEVTEIEAFRVAKGQLMMLKDKCWHSIAYPLDQEQITLLVIFKKNTLSDDTVFEAISESCELIF